MKKSGFTLVEMVITVAIIIVLSTISVPIYKDYVAQAKLSEAYTLLSFMCEAQKRYYDEYGCFLDPQQSSVQSTNFTNNEKVLGIDARKNKYCTAFRPGYYEGYGSRYTELHVAVPNGLLGKDVLVLQYNITLGRKIVDGDHIDVNWR